MCLYFNDVTFILVIRLSKVI